MAKYTEKEIKALQKALVAAEKAQFEIDALLKKSDKFRYSDNISRLVNSADSVSRILSSEIDSNNY